MLEQVKATLVEQVRIVKMDAGKYGQTAARYGVQIYRIHGKASNNTWQSILASMRMEAMVLAMSMARLVINEPLHVLM